MIKIFDSNAKSFNSNGIIVIKPIEAIEYKKSSLNGWYLEVTVSSKYKEYILKDRLCVIESKSKLSPQAFRIGNPEFDDDEIKFIANHVIFDAADYFLVDVRPTNMSANNALNWVNDRTDRKSPFKVSSDIEATNTHYFEHKNLLEAFSIIETEWGGSYDIDNWNIKLLKNIGSDKGKLLVYKKNLEGLTIKENWDDVCTRLYSKGPNDLMLPEIYLDSKIQYTQPYTKTLTFESNLDEDATEEQKIAELRNKTQEYLEDNCKPLVTYEISSSSKLAIDNFDIGDIVHIKHPYVNLKVNVVEYTRNVETNRLTSVVLGNYIPDVKQRINSIKEGINKVSNSLSSQEKLIKEQTDLINSLGKKGLLIITDNEMLILDKLPKEEAKYVWRYNAAGWGFSENGYEGPFRMAATIDGSINADFINTGKLDVSLIDGLENLVLKAKNIRLEGYVSANGNVSIDESGTGTFKNAIIKDGNIELYDSNSDKKESILIYNKDEVEITNNILKINDNLSNKKIEINIPDNFDPDTTSPSIEKNTIIAFENGQIYYNYGYQYSDAIELALYNSKTKEYTTIFYAEPESHNITTNIKSLLLPFSLGKVIAVNSNYTNNDTPILNYFTYSTKNIKYYSAMNSEGVEVNKNGVYVKLAGNGLNMIDKTGTRRFDTNGITWMTPYGSNYKDFIVNRETITYGGNRLIESSNAYRINMIDQTNPYIEVALLESIQGATAYGINVWASDKRLKNSISDCDYNALDVVKKIKHRQFKYNGKSSLIRIGYIADELEELDSQLIFKVGKDNLKQPNESYIIPILSKAIQEQQKIIENLVDRVERLEKSNYENN